MAAARTSYFIARSVPFLSSKNPAQLRARNRKRHLSLDSGQPYSVSTVCLVAELDLSPALSILRCSRQLATTVEAGCHRHADHVPSDNMIRNFSDHSANERTFLAWVRTAIAVMAFGFLVEKFDLFLEVAAPSLAGRTLSLPGQKFGNIAGLALIVLGTAMVAIAALRFVRTAKNIDQKELRPGTGSRIDIALAGLLVLLGCALFFYLSHAIVMKL